MLLNITFRTLLHLHARRVASVCGARAISAYIAPARHARAACKAYKTTENISYQQNKNISINLKRPSSNIERLEIANINLIEWRCRRAAKATRMSISIGAEGSHGRNIMA